MPRPHLWVFSAGSSNNRHRSHYPIEQIEYRNNCNRGASPCWDYICRRSGIQPLIQREVKELICCPHHYDGIPQPRCHWTHTACSDCGHRANPWSYLFEESQAQVRNLGPTQHESMLYDSFCPFDTLDPTAYDEQLLDFYLDDGWNEHNGCATSRGNVSRDGMVDRPRFSSEPLKQQSILESSPYDTPNTISEPVMSGGRDPRDRLLIWDSQDQHLFQDDSGIWQESCNEEEDVNRTELGVGYTADVDNVDDGWQDDPDHERRYQTKHRTQPVRFVEELQYI